MEEFEKNQNLYIPKLKEEVRDIGRQIHDLKRQNTLMKNSDKMDNRNIETILNLQDVLKKKGKAMKEMRYREMKYLLNNSKFVFDYFDNKKEISVGKGKQNHEKVSNFFKIKRNTTPHTSSSHSPPPPPPPPQPVVSLISQTYSNKYHQYWQNVNDENPLLFTKCYGGGGTANNPSTEDFTTGGGAAATAAATTATAAICEQKKDSCSKCGSGELIAYEEEGIMICNNRECGSYVRYIVDNNSRPSNKDPPTEVSYTAYIRLNHFKEILSQFQAKQSTQIPEHVLDAIRNRIKKERITDLAKDLDYAKMREILRKLGFNKYFEHIQYINSLFGIKPPAMSDELYQTLCILFIEIQHPYTIHCPSNRTNFFNYTYTFYQLCMLLDQKQYLPFIPLLKDRQKQLEQDQIWAKICKELDWEFIPTV